MTVEMKFDDLSRIPDGDFAAITLALQDVAAASAYPVLSALSNVLLDTVIQPEIDRRLEGVAARPRIVKLQNVAMDAAEIRATVAFAVRCRDHLLTKHKVEAAYLFNAVADGFGELIQSVAAVN